VQCAQKHLLYGWERHLLCGSNDVQCAREHLLYGWGKALIVWVK
jgi:hypothetical protein